MIKVTAHGNIGIDGVPVGVLFALPIKNLLRQYYVIKYDLDCAIRIKDRII